MAGYWVGESGGPVTAICGNSGEVEMRDRDERGGEWRETRREKERRDRRRRECEREHDAHIHIQSQVHDVGGRWGRGGVKERRMSASSAIHALFSLLPVALALLVHLPGMEGKVFEDIVAADSNWVFIDKFVFDNSGGGKVSWELKLETIDPAAGLPNQKTCDACTLYFQGTAFQDGCKLLPQLVREGANRTTCVVRDPTTTLHPINKPIDCAVWDKNMSMEWSSCAQKKYLPSKLLFYNDVEDSISDWLSIYRSDMNCDSKSIRAAMSIPLEVTISNSGELPVLPALKPRYWCVE